MVTVGANSFAQREIIRLKCSNKFEPTVFILQAVQDSLYRN